MKKEINEPAAAEVGEPEPASRLCKKCGLPMGPGEWIEAHTCLTAAKGGEPTVLWLEHCADGGGMKRSEFIHKHAYDALRAEFNYWRNRSSSYFSEIKTLRAKLDAVTAENERLKYCELAQQQRAEQSEARESKLREELAAARSCIRGIKYLSGAYPEQWKAWATDNAVAINAALKGEGK